jgi:hypothetical protein
VRIHVSVGLLDLHLLARFLAMALVVDALLGGAWQLVEQVPCCHDGEHAVQRVVVDPDAQAVAR